MSQGLGPRLREERERRRIDLATIAASTKVNAALFEGLERDDISRWPAGIFRRSFVRAYAAAIGLDPEATLLDFLEQFPDPIDPPAKALGDQQALTLRMRRPQTGLRLTLADAPHDGSRMFAEAARRAGAAALDGGLVLVTACALFLFVGRFWTCLGLFSMGYYFGATLFLGRTPGLRVFAPRARDTDGDASRRHRPAPLFQPAHSPDAAYDRGIGAIASVSGPLSSS